MRITAGIIGKLRSFCVFQSLEKWTKKFPMIGKSSAEVSNDWKCAWSSFQSLEARCVAKICAIMAICLLPALMAGADTLQITTTNLPSGTEMVSYSTQLSATGGTTPYIWSVPTNMYSMSYKQTNSYTPCSGELMVPTMAQYPEYVYSLDPVDFEFPFNGQQLSDLWANKKGMVGFSGGLVVYLNYPSSAYNTNDRVYYSGTTNAITICFDTANLNASCTFYASGSIVLAYDDGGLRSGGVAVTVYTNSVWRTILTGTNGADDILISPV